MDYTDKRYINGKSNTWIFIKVRSSKSGVVTILENWGQRSCIMFSQNVCALTKTVIKIDSTKLQNKWKMCSYADSNCSTSNSSTKRHVYVRMTWFLWWNFDYGNFTHIFYTTGVTLTLRSYLFPLIVLTNSYYYFTINKYGRN